MPTPPSKELFDVSRRAAEATKGAIRGADRNQAVGFAAVKRCRHLLGGMVRLHKSGADDLLGVLLRTLYETWVRGGYGCLGGAEAIEALESDELYHRSRIDADLGGVGPPAGQQLYLRAVARRFAGLLAERGVPEPGPQFPIEGYRVLFRAESFVNVHGGLGALNGFMQEQSLGGRWTVADDRPARPELGRHRLALGVAMFVSCADTAHRASGLPNPEIDVLGTRIQGWRERYGPVEEA